MIDYKTLKPGDVVIVNIEGKDYETVIDEHGVQRFRQNSVLDYMFRHASGGRELNMTDGRDIHNNMMNLNTLAVAFHQGKFDKRDYMEIMMMQGYSVSGFCDLHEFADWHITNPLWSDTPQRIGGEEQDEED